MKILMVSVLVLWSCRMISGGVSTLPRGRSLANIADNILHEDGDR